ncbi:MAG: LTA synthase family protein [Adlercreutzia equolifaciens]
MNRNELKPADATAVCERRMRGAGLFALAVVLGFLPSSAVERRVLPSHSYVVDNLLIWVWAAPSVLAGQRTRASLPSSRAFAFVGHRQLLYHYLRGSPSSAIFRPRHRRPRPRQLFHRRLVFCWALFAPIASPPKLCPQRKRARWDVAANVLAAALLVCLGTMQYQAIDIKSDCDVTVDVWDVRGSYATQGTALCFLSRAQELTPKPPEGYSAEAVDAILAPFAEDPLTGTDGTVAESPSPDTTGNQNSAAPTTGDAAPEQPEALPYDGPNVIAIMNETFSDLSEYPGLEETNAAPTFFHEVADDSLAAGDVYVSAMGGGTCNSEFEFLTGASMGNMGGGVYPYVLYDLEGVDNLASYFRGLGYGTHAIHPAEAANWRRDRIYEQLGFNDFDDITTMEDADTFRDLVTDRATYERVLEKIDEGDGPQFVFDVTIQNHGGYDTGLVPPADAHLESARWNPRWTSFWRHAPMDLRWLRRAERAERAHHRRVLRRHQPGFADWLSRKPASPWKRQFGKGRHTDAISSGRTLRPGWKPGIARARSRRHELELSFKPALGCNGAAPRLPRPVPIGSAPGAARREPERIPGCRGNVALVRRGRGNRRPEDGRGCPEVLRHRPVRPALRGTFPPVAADLVLSAPCCPTNSPVPRRCCP